VARNILLKPILQEYDVYKKKMVRNNDLVFLLIEHSTKCIVDDLDTCGSLGVCDIELCGPGSRAAGRGAAPTDCFLHCGVGTVSLIPTVPSHKCFVIQVTYQ